MAFIEWHDNYSVKVREIDEEHKKLIGMINDLHTAMTLGKGKEKLEEIITRMLEYAQFHFRTEEKYMEKWNYPEIDEHKEEHRKFFEKVHDFQQDFKSDRLFLSVDVLKFLSNWLDDHLQHKDMNYVEFFNSHGLF